MSIRSTQDQQYTVNSLASHDGTTLKVYQWIPARTPKAHLVINHGYVEHARRYDEFACAMNDRQIAVTAFDVRGHGESSGDRGYVSDFKDYVDDLRGVVDKSIKDNSPKFLLGHSNGGLIGLEYIRRDPAHFKQTFNGLILSSPWLAPAPGVIPAYRAYAAKLMSMIYPTFAVPKSKSLTPESITHAPEVHELLRNDNLVLKNATVGWVNQSLLTQKRVLEEVKEVPTPLLFAFGGADSLACPDMNAKYGQAVKSPDKKYLDRKGEYHNILSEVNRKELFDIVADWILSHR